MVLISSSLHGIPSLELVVFLRTEYQYGSLFELPHSWFADLGLDQVEHKYLQAESDNPMGGQSQASAAAVLLKRLRGIQKWGLKVIADLNKRRILSLLTSNLTNNVYIRWSQILKISNFSYGF